MGILSSRTWHHSSQRAARYRAKRRGENIPKDWAPDSDGRQTNDPSRALEGVKLPMGGPEGSALAVMMNVFSAVLSGPGFAGHVTNPYDPSRPAKFLSSDQTRLIHKHDEFKERMEYLNQRVVGSYEMAGVNRIYMPGKSEQLIQEERVRSAILYVEAEIEALNEEAKRIGSYEIMVTDWEEQTESKN
ncbi:hypothetical protein E4T52_08567 [Aureobasidium sp. EXF-3400]|nr:hypothetical protein E4T51_07769 [Aureobasidium sp. EXF-12344]KAI4776512.1 hypothetical protein E4T52_08567 [Aureobasidium sp. EXF-3400]